jgi:acetyl-CoA synthetase
VKDIIWSPPPELVEHANITRFMRAHGIKHYDELVRRSNANTSWFWEAALAHLGVSWFEPYTQVQDNSNGFAWTRWFVGGKINIVANCIDRHAASQGTALIWEGDNGVTRRWTYEKFFLKVSQVSSALLAMGIREGDAVGIYMPMVPEMVAAFFGCLRIGAIVVPVFSAFGAAALATRLSDSAVKVLFTADGVSRRGKQTPLKPEADLAVRECPTIVKVVVFRRLGIDVRMGPNDVWWDDVIDKASASCPTVPLESEDTAMVIYTSGTTGRPKGTVHTHAGALAQVVKELGFTFDLKDDDVFWWVTDIGWMMGPWEMIGATFFGAALVLFEGAPNYPNPDRLWEIVERHKVTHLGLSPTAIRLLQTSPLHWVQKRNLLSLRILGSTGEPWDPDRYQWFFEHVGGKRCPVINISGGTELMGSLLSPLPIAGLKSTTVGRPGLGMDVDVFNDEGTPIRGGIGHLVCKKPAPSMTKGFLGDPQRYLDTYFSKFGPNVWYHGDWAKIDEDGFWFIYGRSDNTIKVGGKRVGPAEVEAALIKHGSVAEAAAIGVPHQLKGETIVCFVVLKPGESPAEPLREELREEVVKHLGKTLKPDAVKFVNMLPKTRSGKIVRGTIRNRFLNRPLGDIASVENADAIEEIARAT